jgi:hypothetical protein
MKFLRLLFFSFLLAALPVVASAAEPASVWTQDYITKVPPIIMKDPFLELLGQTKSPVPYTYEEVVKMSGHSCMMTAASWIMTKMALEKLYPDGQVPVRGQIKIQAPGAADEWNIGVIGQVMAFITGAAPNTGFNGGVFKANDLFIRKDKIAYTKEPTGTKPSKMEWIFTRTDTGKKVAVKWDLSKIQPPPLNEEMLKMMGKKLATGEAAPEEYAMFHGKWNGATKYQLENANKIEGLFTARMIE